jgi:histidine phosphotransferase ChpT
LPGINEHFAQPTNDRLANLIGSRICHDLISPIGAVANGLELMELAGLPRGPEVELVDRSAQNAAARIRYFRLAFGVCGGGQSATDQSVVPQQMVNLLAQVFDGDRLDVQWNVHEPATREEVKAALLAVMCVETALNGTGHIVIRHEDASWSVQGAGPKISADGKEWQLLHGNALTDELAPAAVQFALLPDAAAQIGRQIRISHSEQAVEIRI